MAVGMERQQREWARRERSKACRRRWSPRSGGRGVEGEHLGDAPLKEPFARGIGLREQQDWS